MMRARLYQYLTTTPTWTLVGIVIVLAVILTTSLNLIFTQTGWGHQITPAILGLGMINAFITLALITPLLITILKRAAKLEKINRQLEQEVTVQRQAEQTAVQRAANLALLSEMALACAAIDAEADLPRLIADKLRTLTQAVAVAITTHDDQEQTLAVQYVSVSGQISSTFKKLWGHNIIGVPRPLNPALKQRMLDEVIFTAPDVTGTILNLIPRPIAVALQKILGVGGFTGLALIYNGQLWGTAAIILRADQPTPKQEVALALSHMIAITMHRQAAEKALRRAEEKYRSIVENAMEGIFQITPAGRFLSVNPAMARMYGYAGPQEMIQNITDIGTQIYANLNERTGAQHYLETKGFVQDFETRDRRKDGTVFWTSMNARAICNEQGQTLYYEGTIEDITARKQAEEALRLSEERFRLLLDKASHIAVQGYRPDGTVCYWNKASEQIYGYTAAEAMGQNLVDIIIPPDMRDTVRAAIKQMFETGKSHPPEELWLKRKDGSLTPVYSNHTIIDIPGQGQELFCIDIDLTENKRAEAAQAKLEEQLRQAQKMETIGRLAGGVAHDFNNILTAILGFAELLLLRLDTQESERKYVIQIKNAAERAATLTNQLLAFSRKQILQPKILDLNLLVADIEKMLNRLIGEDIELVTVLDPQLGRVEADPVQMDQVLMNLAVNARDAMPQGGKLTIETKNVYLDENHVRQYMEVKPGPYVMLGVTDTGLGMDAETQAHLFEPFFTTKEVGQGTGLGLAMVYGIIKQSDGYVWVYSEVGQGTTFKIYLPYLAETIQTKTSLSPTAEFQEGDETILLVEDTEMVRNLVENILTESGYTVLLACNGVEALRLCGEYAGPIHLLLTDVVMPGMSGHELAERLTLLRPEVKILYMSGYTDETATHHDMLKTGAALLQKPFSSIELTRKLRHILD